MLPTVSVRASGRHLELDEERLPLRGALIAQGDGDAYLVTPLSTYPFSSCETHLEPHTRVKSLGKVADLPLILFGPVSKLSIETIEIVVSNPESAIQLRAWSSVMGEMLRRQVPRPTEQF